MIMRPVTSLTVSRLACRVHSFFTQCSLLVLPILALTTAAPDCRAGSFAVSPTRIELSDAQSRTVIHIDNPTKDPITIQLRPMAWSQPEGKDQLRPSRDILATPQIITVQPGASQLVRVGALRKADPQGELAYRLLLEEIPPPAPPDFKGLQVILKVSLPIFLKPAITSKEKLQISLSSADAQQLSLQISNSGNASAHVRDISLHPAEEPDNLLATYPGSVYVLAGQQRAVVLKPGDYDLGKKFLIKATTQSGPLQFHALPISP